MIVIFTVLLIFVFYFRSSVWSGLSSVSQVIFRPALVVGNNIGEKSSSWKAYFISKNSLLEENQNLKSQILEDQADRTNYHSVVAENEDLKEILNRQDLRSSMTLGAILGKPSQTPYDTLLIDIGAKHGVQEGEIVFALGNIPIGTIAEVYGGSAKVVLFSSPGEVTGVMIRGVFMELIGRGGGNFEIILPRDFVVLAGDTVVVPGINPDVVAVVETIISDPRNPFTKALLVSLVNVQELKFVQVDEQK